MSLRLRKVAETMREVLGEVIEFKLKDPRVGLTTVSGVEVTSDLRNAVVYLSMFGEPAEKEEAVQALNGAAGYLRKELGKRMRVKNTPSLVFREDPSIERGLRIEKIIRDIGEGKTEPIPMSDALAKVIELLRTDGPFLVFVHVDPDGDALGSALTLTSALRRAGREAALFLPAGDAVPQRYAEWYDPSLCTSTVPEGAFTALVLDCASRARALGQEALDRAARLVNIDHHRDNPGYGDIVLIEPAAASVGIIVMRLMEGLGLEPAGHEIELLYLSIMTDTGRFAYANTDPEALRRAAALIELGADPASLSRRFFETNTLSSVRLIGRAIERMELLDEGRMVFSSLLDEDFSACGGTYEDSEDVINVLRTVSGTDLTALAKQKDGSFKVSLRSVRPMTCGDIAARFGGGGHALAAGYSFEGSLEELRSSLLAAVAELR